MAPSAITDDDAVIASKMPPPTKYPPPKIFPMKEAKFEKTIPVQQDGRDRAAKHDDAAIVIDNGQSALPVQESRRFWQVRS